MAGSSPGDILSPYQRRLFILLGVATAVRRYMTAHNLPLGTELPRLQLLVDDTVLAGRLQTARADIMSITRARQVTLNGCPDPDLETVEASGNISLRVAL